MDSTTKSVTPTKLKNSQSIGKKTDGGTVRSCENVDPNVSIAGSKSSSSPLVEKYDKSGKKSVARVDMAIAGPNPSFVVAYSPLERKKKIRERKFVIAKKKSRNQEFNLSSVSCEKCRTALGKSKCLCVAYQALRASQETFFSNTNDRGIDDTKEREEIDEDHGVEVVEHEAETGNLGNGGALFENELGESGLKRSRDRFLEEARETVPESGRVMHLVKAFEKLKMIPKSGEAEADKITDDNNKGIKWALPGLQQQSVKDSEIGFASSSTFCPSDLFLTSESLGLDSRSFSLDSSHGSISRTSGGGPRSRRSSSDSTGTLNRRKWKRKQRKATSLKPFALRTEQRGKSKEEEFTKKLQQQKEEEERLRIPIAQGLPWTTDEPECLVKPPVKEITKPGDMVLHSDVRAVERAEFDHQVAAKMDFIEQYRMEKEREQKLIEEEEIRRLRKELVPKAQPLPYFDRPFIPKRSTKQPTIPKEPKFHMPQHKKIRCYMSLDGNYSQSSQQLE